MARTKLWLLQSRAISEVVAAVDQWAAWNTLRTRPSEDFGLIVTAQPQGSNERHTIPVHTSKLMRSWDRSEEAEAFDDLARSEGLIP